MDLTGRDTVRATKKKKNNRAVTAVIIVAAVLLAAAGGGAFAGWKISNGDTVLQNVYVGDILLGGLTKEQAKLALEQRGWTERTGTPLKVTLPADISFEVDPVRAGGALSIDNAVDAAFTYGHNGNIAENLITWFELLVKSVDVNELCRQSADDYIDSCIESGTAEFEKFLGDTEYVLDQEKSLITMTKGWGQTEFDTADLHEKIEDTLSEGGTELRFQKLARELVTPDFVKIRDELDKTPVNAEYTDDNKFNIVDEVDGAKLDASKAAEIWRQAELGDSIEIPVEMNYPEIRNKDLEDRLFRDMLGAMTTRYTNSTDNRCSNVRLATSKINGVILYPGDVFAYNTVVGARTAEAGFLPAPAYVAVGEASKDEIGGGACQVSSTLYASTQFAFLEVVERSNHIFPVNYIQIGTDATVTIPEEGNECDFKFRNNKNYPIKIVGYTEETEEEKRITFEIWGTLEDTDYMPVEFENSQSWEIVYDRTIEPAYQGREGYKIKFEVERYGFEDDIGNGTRTLTHRVVYNSAGEEVENTIINIVLPSGEYGMDTYYVHNVN